MKYLVPAAVEQVERDLQAATAILQRAGQGQRTAILELNAE